MKLSVCCITYNQEKFIAEAIESFLMQKTNFDFEIVIGEDCSGDNTLSIINYFTDKYPNKIRLLENKANIGMIPNFIRTIKACTGKYIAICEGDDYWTDADKLQKQVDFMDSHEEYVLSYHYSETLNDSSKIFSPAISKNAGNLSPEDIFAGYAIPTATVLFRNIINTYPPEFSKIYNGDTFLFCLLADTSGKSAYFDNCIGPSIYRQHENGNWSSLQWLKKYSHSFYTMSVLYKLFKNYRLQIKERMHQMLLEAKKVMPLNNYLQYYYTYIRWLLRFKEFGLLRLAIKSLV